MTTYKKSLLQLIAVTTSVFLIATTISIMRVTDDEHVTILIKKKESISTYNDHQYMIYAEGETFTNADSIWYWKFNSSDIYGEISEGVYCRAHVCGWRVPFLSMYRNIISISVEQPNPTGEENEQNKERGQ